MKNSFALFSGQITKVACLIKKAHVGQVPYLWMEAVFYAQSISGDCSNGTHREPFVGACMFADLYFDFAPE